MKLNSAEMPLEVTDRLPVREEANPPVAVIVFHGIGEQLPYETLSVVASSIVETSPNEAGAPRDNILGVGLLPGDGDPYPYTEIELALREGAACTFEYASAPTMPPSDTRLVHMYECYWAPDTSGLVRAYDVIAYLVSAGAKGFWRCIRGGLKFRRRVFGMQIDYPLSIRTLGNITLALCVVVSIAVLGLAVLGAAFSRLSQLALDTGHTNIVEALEIRLTLSAWDIAVAFIISSLTFLVIGAVARKLEYQQHRWLWSLRRGVLSVAVAITLGAIVAEGVLVGSTAIVYAGYTWGVGEFHGCREALMTRAYLPVLVQLTDNTIPGDQSVGISAERLRVDRRARAGQRIVTLLVAVVAYWVGRRVLIDYVGDVVVYVSAHKVSRFQKTRQRIIEEAHKLLSSVLDYRTDNRPTYEHVILVGHSLGSVIVYDAFNQFINEKSLPGGSREDLDRIAAIVTLGSPLDKVAFLFNIPGEQESEVRQQYNEAMRPMISNYGSRPPRWVNIWSWYDWIGAPLRFYDTPPDGSGEVIGKRVRSYEDLEGAFPLREHTRYWYHTGVRALLRSIVIGCDPLKLDAPRGTTVTARR